MSCLSLFLPFSARKTLDVDKLLTVWMSRLKTSFHASIFDCFSAAFNIFCYVFTYAKVKTGFIDLQLFDGRIEICRRTEKWNARYFSFQRVSMCKGHVFSQK